MTKKNSGQSDIDSERPDTGLVVGFASSAEAATFLRVSKPLINKLVLEGKIPCQRFGRALRISWKWLREQE